MEGGKCIAQVAGAGWSAAVKISTGQPVYLPTNYTLYRPVGRYKCRKRRTKCQAFFNLCVKSLFTWI